MTGYKPTYRIMGDRALLVELGDEISPSVNQDVRGLFLHLGHHSLHGIIEIIPGYRSLLIIYDPLQITLSTLRKAIDDLHKTKETTHLPESKSVKIPIVYGGKYGPDLEWVAEFHEISTKEVIQLHTGSSYQVYMIGFIPGFPYMGELPETLNTPRKKTPRTSVPSGSVGIAQKQTGIYPAQSPGGWQIIGRTPLKLFDPVKSPPTLLEMGDEVTFFSIKEEEMTHWEA